MQVTCVSTKKLLSHRKTRILRVYENATIVIPVVDCRTVQLEGVGGRWIGIHQNKKGSVGITTGKDSHK